MGSTRRAVAILVIGIGCTLAQVTAASANHYDSMYPTGNAGWTCSDGDRTDNFCQTDNATLTAFFGQSMSAGGESNTRATLNDSYTTTALNVSYPSTVVLTGSAETDIVYRVDASQVPSGFIGWTYCDDAVSLYQCDQHYVYFEFQPSITLACHETGHAVGLTHGDDASPQVSNTADSLHCMRTPISYADRWVGQHNADQINATY